MGEGDAVQKTLSVVLGIEPALQPRRGGEAVIAKRLAQEGPEAVGLAPHLRPVIHRQESEACGFDGGRGHAVPVCWEQSER